jgi:acyl-CoA thioester hydrolase
VSGGAADRGGHPRPRGAYLHFRRIPTRWMDNDVYGHVNNVVYYSFFDTVVNQYLVEAGVLDFEAGEVVGLVVETRCRYFAPVSFPQVVDAGRRVARLGTTSVRYEIGLFFAPARAPAAPTDRAAPAPTDDVAPAAEGHFVHVYVDRQTRRPVPLPPALRAALAPLAGD